MKRALLVVAAILVPAPPCAAQGLSLEVGTSIANGRYFYDERTTTIDVSAGAALEAGRFTMRVTQPLVLQNTALVAGSGAGRLPTGGPMSRAVADSGRTREGRRSPAAEPIDAAPEALTGYEAGAGDALASVDWLLVDRARASFTLGAAAKVPFAEAARFGTGEWDFGLTAGAARSAVAGSRFSLSVDVAYWRLGDPPEIDLRNPILATGSLGVGLGQDRALHLFVSGGSSALRGYDGPLSAGLGWSRVGTGGSHGLTLTLGFSETVPDLALGFNVSRGLFGS